MEYLAHIISGEGVATDPKKIAIMMEWPIPKDLKALRGFLGLIGYYRRFVQDYGKIATPLTRLLKKDNFHWHHDAQISFEHLKRKMVELPILTIPDFSKDFTIERLFYYKKGDQWLFIVKPCQKGHKLSLYMREN